MRKAPEVDHRTLAKELDAVEPDAHDAIDAGPLRELSRLTSSRKAIDQQLVQAVAQARHSGISWTYIAVALGVSRQAARQKYSALIGGQSFSTGA